MKDFLIACVIVFFCSVIWVAILWGTAVTKPEVKSAEVRPPPPSDGVKDETREVPSMKLGSTLRSWVKVLPTGERILVIIDDNSGQSHFILLPPLPKVQAEKP